MPADEDGGAAGDDRRLAGHAAGDYICLKSLAPNREGAAVRGCNLRKSRLGVGWRQPDLRGESGTGGDRLEFSNVGGPDPASGR